MIRWAFIVAAIVAAGWFATHVAKADEPGNGPVYVPPVDPIGESVQIYSSTGRMGTGTILSVGLILTAAHVVTGADVMIVLHDGSAGAARVVAGNTLMDIAVLQPYGLKTRGLDVDCSPLQEGDKFHWYGNPVGFEWNLGEGVVSSTKGKSLAPWEVAVSAPFNHGDSGSAILNDDNKIRGVVVSTIDNGIGQNSLIVPSSVFCPMIISLLMGS